MPTPRAALALAEAQAEAARRNIARERSAPGRRPPHARAVACSWSKEQVVAAVGRRSGRRPTSIRIAARIAAAREQVRVAERQVDVQQTDLDNTIIRAPFSGIAISKDAQPGEMVSPVSAGGGFTRTGICTIVDMQSLEIEVDVNETLHQPRRRPARTSRRCSTPIRTGRFRRT